MALTKKVFIGSLFEFTQTGTDEVLDGFKSQYADPESVPFVSYDRKNQVFSCEIEPNDHNTVALFNSQIDTYITLHCRKPNEPFDSDRMIPIDGTTFRDDVQNMQRSGREPNLLFDLDTSSNEEDDESSAKVNHVYWEPRCRDMSILNNEIAAQIADMTGTLLVPDHVRQRVQLLYGNVQAALEKLQRLEDVLALTFRHRPQTSSYANANVLVLNSGSELTIRFVQPQPMHLGFGRIMVNSVQIPLLNQVLLGELRVWKETRRVKPLNLDLEEISLTARVGSSKLFGQSTMTVIGSAKSAEPRVPSKDNSQTSGEIQRPVSPTKFLGQRDTERVEEWRGKIDQEATPTLPPEEPASDDEKKPSRRRLVIDSSSDDDDVVSSPVKKTQPKTSFNKDLHPSSDIELGTKHDHADKLISNSASIRPTTAQTPEPVRASKVHTKSNNMFDLIKADDNDDLQTESKSTSSLPSQSHETVKRNNVTFEEAKSWRDEATEARNSLLSPKFKAPTFNDPDASKSSPKRHVSGIDSGTNRKSSTRVRGEMVSTEATPRKLARNAALDEQVPIRPPREYRTNDQRSAYHTREYGQSRSRPRNLIDISTDAQLTHTIMPPPGFDYRSSDSFQSSSSFHTPPQYMSESQPQPQGQNLAQISEHNSATSFPLFAPADPRNTATDFIPQLAVPKRDINYLKTQALAKLEKQMHSSRGQTKSENSTVKENKLPSNQINANDEHSSRVFHQTMGQKMAKPSKNKKVGQVQESKSQREARIAKAKAEAYGDTTTAKSRLPESRQNTRVGTSASEMSARKRSLLPKNSAMAELHQDVLTSTSNKSVATKLVTELKPILQATRAFKGAIKVEIQLGQALILRNNRLDEGRLYTPKDWEKLFNDQAQTDTKVAFTNILTTNGQDIDRMLEIKAESGSTKLWNRDNTGAFPVTFEFACEDKSGRIFMLSIDHDGTYRLENIESIIGKIVIHAPGQIWDACAVVSGTMKVLRPSEELITGIQQFRENLHVPGGKKAAIYYRLPSNNAFTIKAIIMKRVSVHDCLVTGRTDVQLRITEVKNLAHSSNPVDKKLFRSFESSYEVMSRESRIHYQVSILDKAVEGLFSENPDIELGELATFTAPDEQILNATQALNLVETTSHMLSNIDWAGAHNIGTLKQLAIAEVDRNHTLVSIIPPNISHSIAIPMGQTAPPTLVPTTTFNSNYSRVAGTTTGTNAANAETVLRPLHGVRTNTAAELYQDRTTGELFYYGQGGARIPVVNDQLEGVRYDGQGPVLPADSASQIGESRMRMEATQSIRGRGGVNNDKPPGFW